MWCVRDYCVPYIIIQSSEFTHCHLQLTVLVLGYFQLMKNYQETAYLLPGTLDNTFPELLLDAILDNLLDGNYTICTTRSSTCGLCSGNSRGQLGVVVFHHIQNLAICLQM